MTIHGTYRAGRIELDSPVDWEDGVRVAVTAPTNGTGIREEDFRDDEAFRQELLARMDSIEPLELSAQERADIESFREQIRDATIESVRRQMGSSE